MAVFRNEMHLNCRFSLKSHALPRVHALVHNAGFLYPDLPASIADWSLNVYGRSLRQGRDYF